MLQIVCFEAFNSARVNSELWGPISRRISATSYEEAKVLVMYIGIFLLQEVQENFLFFNAGKS